MAREDSNSDVLPLPVEQFLAKAHERLGDGKIDCLRLCPLILHSPLGTLVARRHRLFDWTSYSQTEYGFNVTFRRRLKRSKSYPDGRECSGEFDLLALSEKVVLVTSHLAGDHHKQGSARFAEKAYPLARRPFFPSTTLLRLIDEFAANRNWTATTRETWGYHQQSRRPRRDLERQAPSAAALEMAEQGRYSHRMLMAFQTQQREVARLSLDRYATVKILKGNPLIALKGLVIPGIFAALESDATYEVVRAQEPIKQEAVDLEFAGAPFHSFEAMHELCAAVRLADGLNVAIIHLNPYLQAQILDFFTGSAVEMLVTDERSISLVPRSGNCAASIQRIANTIFRFFGEGKPKRTRLAADS